MLITNNLNSDATRYLPAAMVLSAHVENNKESRQLSKKSQFEQRKVHGVYQI